MFRVISAILFFIVFFLVSVFLIENVIPFTTEVSIHYNIYFYRLEPVNVPVWVLMLLMLAAGIAMTFFIELIGWFKTRSRIVRQNRNIKNLEKELQESRQGRDARYGEKFSDGAVRAVTEKTHD